MNPAILDWTAIGISVVAMTIAMIALLT